jgi:diguanylate cyclase (GGDEF)-like protein/PAS domain S-box-containing protein
MWRVLDNLLLDHDLRLVLLAAAICVFGAVSTMSVSGRAAGKKRTALWLVLLSVCAGATVWSTHFIAMLAYRVTMPMTYDAGLTALSFAVGAAVMGLGFFIAMRFRRGRSARLIGGAILGLGVVLLHYLGMAALRMPGHLSYSPGLVAASIVFSLGFGALSLFVEFGPVRPLTRVGSTALMIVMIVALHFTAMGAVIVQHALTLTTAADGVSRSVLVTAVAVASLFILLVAMTGALVDQRVSRRLAAEADRFRTLAEGAFEGIIVHRNGMIVDANGAARRMFGLAEHGINQSIDGWFEAASGEFALRSADSGDDRTMELVLRRPDGSSFPAEICRRRMLLTDGAEGELFAIRDLTARKESEARLAHIALHDQLTELPNRRFFMELAQKNISLAQRTGERFALLALDLDDFKLINDMHGHAAGDELIRVTSKRIAATVRDSDISARFGGDEFAVVQTCASQPHQAIALAERLLDALRAPISLDGVEVVISVSVGVALYPDDGNTVQDLLRNADTAMYRAKADGKATCRFFEPQMDAALVARRKLEQGLRRAVADDRLSVVYQPIVDSGCRTPLAFEALVRWHDDELGLIMPGDFIPVAEETGLIVPIGEFVLRRACFDAMTWPAPLRVAVNLSAVQFRRKGLMDTVRRALEDSGLPGSRLELEVTETLLVENRDDALRVLTELKTLGVRIAMDDFGTGYSSLSYLQCFPFDKIKIDRVFVSDLPGNTQNASIVRAVAAMGKSLKMRVVAEGVQTDVQADLMKELECDEMQGFLIARPMNAGDIEAFLLDYRDETTGVLRLVGGAA